MRLAFAVLSAVIGAALAVLGVLQLTVLAPDESITVRGDSGDAPLVVVQPGVLNLYDTPATLTVRGEGDLVITEASAEDVTEWVGDTTHASVTGLAAPDRLEIAEIAGESTEAPSPAGGDLWRQEATGTGEVSLDWDAEAGRSAFLIASDGTAPAAQEITITWPNDTAVPWAIPLIVIGGLLLLVAAFLFVLQIRHQRRQAARRAKRQERRRKLAQTGTAMMLAGGLALAGCGAEPELPQPDPEAAPTEAQPVMTPEQSERILASVLETVAAADAEGDADRLGERAVGPALDIRTKAYAAHDKAEEVALPPALGTELVVNHMTRSDGWPRVTTMVVNQADPAQTQVLNLLQEDARQPWKLWSQTVLFGEAVIPETEDVQVGADLLAADQDGLRATPAEVAEGYAAVLGDPEAEQADLFAEDGFRTAVADGTAELKKAIEDGNGKFERTYAPGDGELVATRTADGGALVTARLNSTTTMEPEQVDGRSGKLSLSGQIAALVGEEEASGKVTTTTGLFVTFAVPPRGDDQIQVLGATETLTSAKEDD